MLEQLKIHNFAIVRDLEVEFEPGLNVLTGPTGSGKTLLLDALRLTLGERADFDLIASDEEPARVEARVSLNGESISLARELLPDHRSRARRDGDRVRVRELRSLREQTIDFHGQHENQLVFEPDYPRRVLDRFGTYGDELETYRAVFERYRSAERELEELQGDEQQIEQQVELLEFQISELDELDPGADEWEEIEGRRRRLESAEEVSQHLRDALRALDGQDRAQDSLGTVRTSLEELAEFDSAMENWLEELPDLQARLEELRQQLAELRGDLEHSEDAFDQLMERRSRWLELSRKHNVPPERLAATYREFVDRLEGLRNRDRRREELLDRLDELEPDLEEAASELRSARRETARDLEDRVRDRLEQLNLEQARFTLEVLPDDPGPHGADRVLWRFASHESQDPGPLDSRVSGGEISRVLLAIKASLADADPVPILVFDEIDAGISGEEADQVGRVLRQLAESHQVLCITHLPLVAAYADHHVLVSRTDEPDRVSVTASPLDEESKVEELSRLIAADQDSATAQTQARELLKQAG